MTPISVTIDGQDKLSTAWKVNELKPLIAVADDPQWLEALANGDDRSQVTDAVIARLGELQANKEAPPQGGQEQPDELLTFVVVKPFGWAEADGSNARQVNPVRRERKPQGGFKTVPADRIQIAAGDKRKVELLRMQRLVVPEDEYDEVKALEAQAKGGKR